MFEWTFEFGWFEDLEEEIPVMSGGIMAMTKEWWKNSGEGNWGAFPACYTESGYLAPPFLLMAPYCSGPGA